MGAVTVYAKNEAKVCFMQNFRVLLPVLNLYLSM